jgi:hypothetical protein
VQAQPAPPPYPYPYAYPTYPPPLPPAAPARRSPYGDVLGLGLRLGAVFPLGDGYARGPAGMLVDLSFWYEGKYFALEPRVGVRFDVKRGPNTYAEVPIDFGGYFLIGGGAASFFVGGGIGAHHIWETRGEDIVVGGVIPARMERRSDDQGWGFGAFARIGVVFIRSFRQRLILSLEYNFTAVELNGFRNPTSLTCGLGFVL